MRSSATSKRSAPAPWHQPRPWPNPRDEPVLTRRRTPFPTVDSYPEWLIVLRFPSRDTAEASGGTGSMASLMSTSRDAWERPCEKLRKGGVVVGAWQRRVDVRDR